MNSSGSSNGNSSASARRNRVLNALIVAPCIAAATAVWSAEPPATPAGAAVPASPADSAASAAAGASQNNVALSNATSAEWRTRRGLYYRRNLGIDVVGVHPVSSGLMLTFRYRVLDAERAKAFGEKKTKPYLIDNATGTALAVPAMENVGELRQTAALEEGREYFIVFGNPGKLVKPGSLVTLVVGSIRIEGLVVD